ncbi:MAG: hypothetical protein HY243_13270 [Proteobacteria bacterium]|nr:hypothetical protein [Pseudomonadota bacterium]
MSQPEGPLPPARPHWTALSLVLFIIGLLILVPSGLCTGIGGIVALFGNDNVQDALAMLLMVLIYGAVPVAIGAVLVYAGLKARKRD